MRVLLVDDHAMFREGLRFMLERHADIEVVGEAGDGDEVPDLVRATDPDVVVMDLAMPRVGGHRGDRGAGPARQPGQGAGADPVRGGRQRAGRGAGRRPRLPGQGRRGRARRSARCGRSPPGTRCSGRAWPAGCSTSSATGVARASSTSRRASARCSSWSRPDGRNQQIADVLVISPVTVRNHVSAILAKLQVTNRREAMLRFHGTGGDTPIRTDV